MVGGGTLDGGAQGRTIAGPYFHVVFTLPATIAALAFQKKAKVYGLLFQTAAETLTTIAADPKHLGAEIGVTALLKASSAARTPTPSASLIAISEALTTWTPRRAPRDKPCDRLKSP